MGRNKWDQAKLGRFKRNIGGFLYVARVLGVLILVIMFINFNSQLAAQTQNTREVVKSQNEILEAIKQQAIDNKLTSEEKTSIIICMLQVSIEERTTDVLNNCRDEALAGGNGITDPTEDSIKSNNTQSNATPSGGTGITNEETATTPQPQPGTVQQVLNSVGNATSKAVDFVGSLF